jgi:hypothetical protein
MTKKILLGVVVALLVIGAYVGSLYYRADSKIDAYDTQDAALGAYYAGVEADAQKQRAAEAADVYGGTTPQETWSLFVAALEAGDTDLAAKYFVVEKQEKWKDILKKGKESGYLELQLKNFKTIKSEEYGYNKKDFNFITSPVKADDRQDLPALPFMYRLKLVDSTQLWKIYDL